MRIGVMTDIHSNIAALDAMLAEFARRGVDEICVTGDIIGIGARPDETVMRLTALDNLKVCVLGNHELYFTRGLYERMDAEEAEFHRWEHSRLSAPARDFLRALPEWATYRGAYFTHFPRVNGEFARPGEHGLLETETGAAACFFGHDHRRIIWRAHGRLYCNPGSLGCPGPASVARAAIYDTEIDDIELVDASYDADAVAREILKLDYPAAATILRIFYGGRRLRG